MDQLSYDLGRLITEWRIELKFMGDETLEKRARRSTYILCIDGLNHVIKKNTKQE